MIFLIILLIPSLLLLAVMIETLIWWRHWRQSFFVDNQPHIPWKRAAILLTGISDFTDGKLTDEQIQFVRQMGKDFDCDLVIEEAFPYLQAEKTFSHDWRWNKLLILYALRNFWQFALATALHRIYGQDIAHSIGTRLGKPETTETTQATLYCICGSAGAAYALAAAPFLKQSLGVKLIILAYGGIFASVEGFDHVEHFYQLLGKKDAWAQLSTAIFLNFWVGNNAFEKAKIENRYIERWSGCHTHFGNHSYLSDQICAESQKIYRQLTIDAARTLAHAKPRSL
ncbi:MAG: hypothetical protein H7Y37_19760 [Anaerolineae bacterium]|nr:hypothetical protein [Gloeobacterales cyanobacterium ES-bin-313]